MLNIKEKKLREYIRKYIKETISEVGNNYNDTGLKKIEITGEFVYWPNDGWYLEVHEKDSRLAMGDADSYRVPDKLATSLGLDNLK